ncbi:hypothetical protein KEM55_006199, partial [Ascosphaera atra]
HKDQMLIGIPSRPMWKGPQVILAGSLMRLIKVKRIGMMYETRWLTLARESTAV